MNCEATFQGAAVSQPPAGARYSMTWQSPTPKFLRFPCAAWRALRKVGTLFPLFKALATGAILSAPSIESLQSKIQTPSGKFRRSRLRNVDPIATPGWTL